MYIYVYIKLNFDRSRPVIAFVHRMPNGQYIYLEDSDCILRLKNILFAIKYIIT